MEFLYYYIDFLLKTFDTKSKLSRKGFGITILLNNFLMILLVSVGLSISKGRPLEIYIALSSIISTPLIIPYITLFLRRLNDVGKSRLFGLLMVLPAGIGMVPLLIICSKKSQYGTIDDFSVYREKRKAAAAIAAITENIVVTFPFVYWIYILFKIIMNSGILGVNIALLSINSFLCILTAVRIFMNKTYKFASIIVVVKKLTQLSNAILTIILYQNTENFIEAIVIVYLFFYVMINPVILIYDIYNISVNIKKEH